MDKKVENGKILIVDDVELNREALKVIFESEFKVEQAEDGQQAIDFISSNGDEISLILLDMIMPRKSGLDVLKFMRKNGYTRKIPVIIITSESTSKTEENAYKYGASDIIYKPFSPNVILRRAENIIELFKHRRCIEETLEERTRQLRESQEKLERSNEILVNALSSIVEFRSTESGEHIQRVKYFTKVFLKHIMNNYPQYGITDEQATLIVSASALHDIGKIAIPDNILLKPGKLTNEEFEIMKQHTIYGCEILNKFKQVDNPFYQYCYDICRYHHERYDGRGYPDGLEGEDIPIWSQIVSIIDVYDALVSKRVYKQAYAVNDAIRMILNGECGTFSPNILNCFQSAKDELCIEYNKHNNAIFN